MTAWHLFLTDRGNETNGCKCLFFGERFVSELLNTHFNGKKVALLKPVTSGFRDEKDGSCTRANQQMVSLQEMENRTIEAWSTMSLQYQSLNSQSHAYLSSIATLQLAIPMCWQGNHVAQQCFTSGYPLWTLEALGRRWCWGVFARVCLLYMVLYGAWVPLHGVLLGAVLSCCGLSRQSWKHCRCLCVSQDDTEETLNGLLGAAQRIGTPFGCSVYSAV